MPNTHTNECFCINIVSFCFLSCELQLTGSLASSLFLYCNERPSGQFFRRDAPCIVSQRPGGLHGLPALHRGDAAACLTCAQTTAPAAPATLATCRARASAKPEVASPPTTTSASRLTRARPGDEIPVAENRQAAGGARHLHQQRHAPQQLVRPSCARGCSPPLKEQQVQVEPGPHDPGSLSLQICLTKTAPLEPVGHLLHQPRGSHSESWLMLCEWKNSFPRLGTD